MVGRARGQPGVALYRHLLPRLDARGPRRGRPAPEGGRRPPHGLQHPRRGVRGGGGGRDGEHRRRVPRRGAHLRARRVRDPRHPPEHPGAHVRGDGGGPHLPAVGAARPAGGAGTTRAGGAAGAPAPAASAAPPGSGAGAARGAARPPRVRGRLHPGPRGRDRDHGPLCGEPSLRDGSGGHGLVRARRLLRRGARTRPPSSSSTRARRWRSRSSSPPRWPGCSPSSSAGSACA